ncbi:hypothetical protein DFH08DRAFT_795640 [Mycena albidolilacea]|uniref:Uncharacterized protein n=1 Tax=Mycena albidolilacea TaxID=1033008 RepID=A0AAD7ASY5_9AGAR|nr:hypothetical protein DFH08DRAFT_795640 [Mycena albidolilacea]
MSCHFVMRTPVHANNNDPAGLSQRVSTPLSSRPSGPSSLPLPPAPRMTQQHHMHQYAHAAQQCTHQTAFHTPTVVTDPSLPHVPYRLADSVSGHVVSLGPIPKAFNLSSASWTEANTLSLKRDNFTPWSERAKIELGMQSGASHFLSSTNNPCLSFTMFPGHRCAWHNSDEVVQNYLKSICIVTERHCFKSATMAVQIWEILRTHHEHRRPIGQIKAMCKIVSTHYSCDTTFFSAMTQELRELNESIWAVGPVNANCFLLTCMLASLTKNHHKFVRSMLTLPHLDLATLKDNLLTIHEFKDDNNDVACTATSAPAKGGKQTSPPTTKPHCVNEKCAKRDMHTWPYCTSPGWYGQEDSGGGSQQVSCRPGEGAEAAEGHKGRFKG